MNSADINTLKAFIQALAQQEQPLPEAIRQAMPGIGYALEQRDPAAIEQLRNLVNAYEPLQTAYRQAYQNDLRQYQAQERTKGFNGTATTTWEANWIDRAAQVLISDEHIMTARRLLKQISAQPISRASEIREKGNRLFVMAAGGAFLGGAIAQVPGAIVGMIVATLFGWFSSPTKANPNRIS